MSAKKSASNIRPQDREGFNAKLQALHTELDEKLHSAAEPGAGWNWRNPRPLLHKSGEFTGCSDRVDNYENLYGRRCGDVRVADMRRPDRHIRWTHEIFGLDHSNILIQNQIPIKSSMWNSGTKKVIDGPRHSRYHLFTITL